MKELIVICLIVLVIYLNQSQCKTQKGGATATKVGMSLMIIAIIAVAGYFAYKELSGPSPSNSDDSDDTGSSGNIGSESSHKQKKRLGDVTKNYYFTDIRDAPVYCSPAANPAQICPDGTLCPSNGVCPSTSGDTECSSYTSDSACKSPCVWDGKVCKDCKQITESSCGGTKDNHDECVRCMGAILPDCRYLTDPLCESSKPEGIPLTEQETASIQLVNATSQDFLHIFLQSYGESYTLKSNTSAIINPLIKYTSATALPTLGALIYSEAIIPKGTYIIVDIPVKDQGFRITPLKHKNTDSATPLTKETTANQWAVSNELTYGSGGVANVSAVDGINYRMKYELTTSDGVKEMSINKNPCDRLEARYQLEVGCRNPAKLDCNDTNMPSCLEKSNDNKDGINWCGATATCKPSTQICKFNDCTKSVFNVPDDLNQYDNEFDTTGNAGTCQRLPSTRGQCPVKKFVMDSSNLKDGPLKHFCEDVQFNNGDFTTYCYDYNDSSSSPIFSGDHKLKITYSDL